MGSEILTAWKVMELLIMGRSAGPIQGWNARLGMFRLLTSTALEDLVVTTTAATLMESPDLGATQPVRRGLSYARSGSALPVIKV